MEEVSHLPYPAGATPAGVLGTLMWISYRRKYRIWSRTTGNFMPRPPRWVTYLVY
jgi:hypothetical protein